MDSCTQIIQRTLDKLRRAISGDPPWQRYCYEAWTIPAPPVGKRAFEQGLVGMIEGAALYADAHRAAYGSPIGDDGVLGPEYRDILRSLLGLLNGELGRLDGGTVDGILRDIASAAGVEIE